MRESAILARRILNSSSIATLSTVFPSDYDRSSPFQDSLAQTPLQEPFLSNPPPGLSNAPIGLMDYYAPCLPQPSNPTLLAITIATTFRNTASNSNISLSLRWHPPPTAPPSSDPYTYSPMNMPRVSLIGYIEPIPEEEVKELGVAQCFFSRHEEAEAWRPGGGVHESWWGRLVVRSVYWIGGFGDRAFIGWIPEETWEGVREWEVEKARLVGEDGWERYEEVMGRGVMEEL